MEEDRDAILDGIEEMVALLRTNPAIPLPGINFDIWAYNKEAFKDIARLLGSATKQSGATWFSLRREFSGGVRLEVNIAREEVCRRVVLGSKWVEPTRGYMSEDVEWICDDPVFADGGSHE